MKIIKNKRNVQTSSKLQKNKFSIKASKLAKNRKIIKASSKSYSMSDYDIVMYRNSEKVYSGSVYDVSFHNKIRTLCKDPENLRMFKDWLLDYGVSDMEDADISESVIDMITYEWEEATDADENFYVEISMYGHKHSDVRFEVFYAKDEVTASTSTKRKYTVKASKKISASQWDDVDEDGYSDSDKERFEREQFVEDLIYKLEREYSFKVPTDTWGKIMDLADDLSFGEGAHKYGSTPMMELEDTIYNIIEEDTGVVIGSTEVLTSQDESLIDELWNACDDIGGLQDIDFDSEDTDGTHIIFIYGDSTNDYDSRESELIEALQAAGYNAEYDANSGTNVIVLHVTRSDNAVESATEINASVYTDVENGSHYLTALAEGVTNNLNDYRGDITQITYEISDSAITFSNESDVVYIQPIDQIEPNWDDLDTDIEELETSIQSEMLPRF